MLRYGIVVWGGLYNNSLKQLQVVQNTLLKIIYKKDRFHPTDLLYSGGNCSNCNIRTLYILSVCSYVHKNDTLKINITHEYSTRIKNNLHIQIPNSYKTANLRFINYLGPKFYNLLPLNIKQIKIHKKFYNICKGYITENYNAFIHLM